MIRLSFISQSNNSLAERENAFKNIKQYEEKGVLLQTCNRIEFYEGEGDVSPDVITHLFRVVSGLESNLTGEIAIQGQVKTAYLKASEKFKLSKNLHGLFQTALFVGKRVRSESNISKGAMSHSQAAVDIISQSGICLDKSIISLIGVHKLNEDILRFLRYRGAETIFLATKTFEKAQELAQRYDCQTMRLDNLKNMLLFSDVLITATAAPHLIVKYENFPKNRKMLILDLAFPRDVDERIGELEGVDLYNLEDIESIVNKNKTKRKTEVKKAEKIIEEEVVFFLNKQNRQKNYQL